VITCFPYQISDLPFAVEGGELKTRPHGDCNNSNSIEFIEKSIDTGRLDIQ